MTKTFTPNDVLRYLYKETSELESQTLEREMLIHTDLIDQYVRLADTKEELDHVRLSPSENTIQAILEYSRSNFPILS